MIYYTAVKEFDPIENENYTSCSIAKDTFSIFKYYISISNFISIGTTYIIPLLIIILSYTRLLSHLSANQRRLARFRETSVSGAFSVQNSTKNKNKKSNRSKNNIDQATATAGEYESLNLSNAVTSAKNRSSTSQKSENRKKKVTQMVAVVTLNFGICWFPTHLFILLKRFINLENPNAFVYLTMFKLLAHTLSYLTPVINPILYAFYNENFRHPLTDIRTKFTCRTNSKNVPVMLRKAKKKCRPIGNISQ